MPTLWLNIYGHIRKNHMRGYSYKKCKQLRFTFNRIKIVQNQKKKS